MLPMPARDWREVDGFDLYPPSTPALISEAEARLGSTFPAGLRDLLLTADRVLDCAGEHDVACRSPIGGDATVLADSLRTFWHGWITGAIHT